MQRLDNQQLCMVLEFVGEPDSDDPPGAMREARILRRGVATLFLSAVVTARSTWLPSELLTISSLLLAVVITQNKTDTQLLGSP